MQQHHRAQEILDDPEFQALARRKDSLSLVLTLITIGVYFGFVGLLAFSPATISGRWGAVTMGIPIGLGVIILSWILTGIYVRWANSSYDDAVTRTKAKFSSGAGDGA